MSYDVYTKDGGPAGTLTVTRKGPRTVFEFQSDHDPGVSRLVLVSGTDVRSLGIPTQRAGGLYLKKTMTKLELEGLTPDDGFTALLVPVEEDYSRLTPAAGAVTAPAPAPEAAPAAEPEPEPAAPVMNMTPPKPVETQKPVPQPEEAPKPVPKPEEKPKPAPKPEGTPKPEPEPEPEPLPCPAPGGDSWREEPEPEKYFLDPALKTSAGRCAGALVRDAEEGVQLAFPWTPDSPFPMLEIFRLCSSTTIDGTEYITYRVKNGEPV